MPKPTVVQTLSFPTPTAADARLKALAARFVKTDPDTGRPLYKTAAGIVLRQQSALAYEVLANCVC